MALLSLTLAGCMGSRTASEDTQPAPLPAAPAGTIEGSKLPPPGGPDAFPKAPADQNVALNQPNTPAGPPPNAPDVTTANVAGVWNVNVSGQSCRVATPQTKFGAGFRAGPLRCPAPVDGVRSWNVAGKQLTLYDQNGGTLAQLYSSGAGRFDGQTTSGQPISLSR